MSALKAQEKLVQDFQAQFLTGIERLRDAKIKLKNLRQEEIAKQAGQPVTVEGLDKLIQELMQEEDFAESVGDFVKDLNKSIAGKEGRIVAVMEEMGRDDYQSDVATIGFDNRWSVNNPATEEDKKLFYNYLRERGIFEAMVSVNSNTLNAYYKRELAEAEERGEGVTFGLPGIGAPKLFKKLRLRRRKGKAVKNEQE